MEPRWTEHDCSSPKTTINSPTCSWSTCIQHGFVITRVSTGAAAIEAIRATPPDLVVLDLMLPEANGLDVCRAVRDQFAGAILMLTASQSETDHVVGLELGADDYVVKPVEPRILLARIRAQLRRTQRLDAPNRQPEQGRFRLAICGSSPDLEMCW